jgi:hypothetical protein
MYVLSISCLRLTLLTILTFHVLLKHITVTYFWSVFAPTETRITPSTTSAELFTLAGMMAATPIVDLSVLYRHLICARKISAQLTLSAFGLYSL